MKKIITEFLKERKSFLFLIILLNLIVLTISYLNPLITAQLIDFLNARNINNSYGTLKLIVTCYIITAIVQYFLDKYKLEIILYFRQEIIQKSLMAMNYRYNSIDTSGDNAMQEVLTDSVEISAFIMDHIVSFFMNIVLIIATLGYLYFLGIEFFFITIMSVPVYIIVMSIMYKPILSIMEKKRKYQDLYTSDFFMIFRTMKLFRILKNEKKIKELIVRNFEKNLKISLKEYDYLYVFHSIEALINIIVQVLFFFIGIQYVFSYSITIGEFTILLSFYNIFMSSVNYYMGFFNSVQNFIVSYNRLNDKINNISESNISGMEKNKKSSVITLSFQNLRCKNEEGIMLYPDKTFYRGQIVHVLGCNGVGKSSLFNLLTNVRTRYSGVVLINNKFHDLENFVAYLPQEFVFFENKSVIFNVNYYLNQSYSEFELYQVLKVEGLLSLFIYNKTNLYNFSKSNISELSGGERQRIALIIIFLLKRNVILLDEPFNDLDIHSIEIVKKEINRRKKSSIIILIDHTNSCLDLIDEQYMLKK